MRILVGHTGGLAPRSAGDFCIFGHVVGLSEGVDLIRIITQVMGGCIYIYIYIYIIYIHIFTVTCVMGRSIFL